MTTPGKVDVLVYLPGSMQPIPHTLEAPDETKLYEGVKGAIRQLIGVGNHIEHVAVLFRDQPHDLFVDEFSAFDEPINEAATLIYHEASRRRGEDNTHAPKIHGVAVLCLTRVWF